MQTELRHVRTRRDNVPSREYLLVTASQVLFVKFKRSFNRFHLNILDCDSGTTCGITIQMRK